MRYKRLLTALIFACLGIISIVSPSHVVAASFPADYDIAYTIDAEGKTRVDESITITNQTDTQYPSQYTLALEGIALEDVSAADALGPLTVTSEPRGDFTLVTVTFNEVVVGRGRQLHWTLHYSTNDITEKKGTMWEVSLPQVQPDERIQSYVIHVQAPVSLGELDYSDPLPVSYNRDEQTRFLSYSFENNTEPIRVIMAFGSKQIVDVDLVYHLQNVHQEKGLIEIALPPSFYPYQKTYLTSLDPEPYSVSTDEEGNMFAQYIIAAGEQQDVTFKGQIWLDQKTLSEITTANHVVPSDSFLSEDTYWEIHSEEVQNAVETIRSGLPEVATDVDIAKAVYSYVVSTLHYDVTQLADPSTLERQGAAHALDNPDTAICTDFTDVTIALMRAMGIPAREVNGFAFTNADDLPTISDVLHAWVQVYILNKGWIQIDPTWGSTAEQDFFDRFDTNHVIFVLKGLDSEYPYPAGSYKIKGTDTDDVSVQFTDAYTPGGIPITLWVQNKINASVRIDFLDWLFRKLISLM